MFSWVLIVLPQRRQMAAHRQLVASLEVGDEVITTAGIYGTITELDADTAHLQVADGVVLRFARAAIGRKAADIVPDARLDHEEHDATRSSATSPPTSIRPSRAFDVSRSST